MSNYFELNIISDIISNPFGSVLYGVIIVGVSLVILIIILIIIVCICCLRCKYCCCCCNNKRSNSISDISPKLNFDNILNVESPSINGSNNINMRMANEMKLAELKEDNMTQPNIIPLRDNLSGPSKIELSVESSKFNPSNPWATNNNNTNTNTNNNNINGEKSRKKKSFEQSGSSIYGPRSTPQPPSFRNHTIYNGELSQKSIVIPKDNNNNNNNNNNINNSNNNFNRVPIVKKRKPKHWNNNDDSDESSSFTQDSHQISSFIKAQKKTISQLSVKDSVDNATNYQLISIYFKHTNTNVCNIYIHIHNIIYVQTKF